MEKKLNLSIILPIKSTLAKDFDTYFESAIKSLTIQKTTFNENYFEESYLEIELNK